MAEIDLEELVRDAFGRCLAAGYTKYVISQRSGVSQVNLGRFEKNGDLKLKTAAKLYAACLALLAESQAAAVAAGKARPLVKFSGPPESYSPSGKTGSPSAKVKWRGRKDK